MPGTIFYATSFLPAADARTRASRQRQSAAAQDLLEFLKAETESNASSKSHSRAAIAAAVGDTGILTLGIDIEFMEPDRPFAALAGFLSEAAPTQIGAEAFYRCWTFAEAYFKAFQRLPPDSAVRAVATHTDADDRYRLDDGTHILHRRIAQRFQLCLVWRSPEDDCELRYMRQ
jgi:hypothetical protein